MGGDERQEPDQHGPDGGCHGRRRWGDWEDLAAIGGDENGEGESRVSCPARGFYIQLLHRLLVWRFSAEKVIISHTRTIIMWA